MVKGSARMVSRPSHIHTWSFIMPMVCSARVSVQMGESMMTQWDGYPGAIRWHRRRHTPQVMYPRGTSTPGERCLDFWSRG